MWGNNLQQSDTKPYKFLYHIFFNGFRMAVTKDNQSPPVINPEIKEAGRLGYNGTLVWIGGSIILAIIFVVITIVFLASSVLSGSQLSDISSSAISVSLIKDILSIIITFIGLYLINSGVQKLSVLYKDPSIKKNFMISFGIIILSLIISMFLSVYVIISLNNINIGSALTGTLGSAFGLSILTLVIDVLLSIISYLFMYKSYDKISKLTGRNEFHTAGIILLIGAVLTVISIGGILIFIGAAYAGYAWYKLKSGEDVSSPKSNSKTTESTSPLSY